MIQCKTPGWSVVTTNIDIIEIPGSQNRSQSWVGRRQGWQRGRLAEICGHLTLKQIVFLWKINSYDVIMFCSYWCKWKQLKVGLALLSEQWSVVSKVWVKSKPLNDNVNCRQHDKINSKHKRWRLKIRLTERPWYLAIVSFFCMTID